MGKPFMFSNYCLSIIFLFNIHFIFFSVVFSPSANAQGRTVGLKKYTNQTYEGYTILAPMAHNVTYLLDNCGRKVHSWNSAYHPGASVNFLPDGRLLRTNKLGNPKFNLGGTGGGVELLDWNSNVLWSYAFSDDAHCQHHDALMLPNGNIILIAWEEKLPAQARALGWTNSAESIWPDALFEIKPKGKDSGEIVWEWHLWDHLVQDKDSTKPNFGKVSDHPELVDINFLSNRSDWTHFNSLSYNEDLDQLMVICHSFSEIWIIDHSTTTAEASDHSGGRYGKGGDLLYRWGNKLAYQKGVYEDKTLYMPHNARWIDKGLPDAGKVMYFNNGADRPGIPYSSVEVISLPQSSPGVYQLNDSGTYGPDTAYWKYTDPVPQRLFSAFISGAQRLPNGNTLICEGNKGNLIEITPEKTVAWEYKSPVNQAGVWSQGDTVTGNLVFRAQKLGLQHPGLQGKDLSPKGFVEKNPLADSCMVMMGMDRLAKDENLNIYPNPFNGQLNLSLSNNVQPQRIEIRDARGMLMHHIVTLTGDETTLHTTTWPSGMYFIHCYTQNGGWIRTGKLIKY